MEVGKYDETNHLPTVNRPPMEIAPNSGAQSHVLDENPEFTNNHLVRREGELLNVQHTETLSETERV